MTFQNILAATDLRPHRDLSLENGIRLAALTGARCHAFHSIGAIDGAGVPALLADARAELLRRAGATSAGLPTGTAGGGDPAGTEPNGSPIASVTVETGAPHIAIRDRARRIGADLIVLGPQARRSRLASLLGNTADRVLRTTRVPCLLSNAPLPERPGRILLAVDGSRHSHRAVRVTADLVAALMATARRTGEMEVRLLNVSAFAEPSHSPSRDAVDLASIAASLARRLRRFEVDVTHETFSAPVVVDGIIEFAERFEPDLLAMGTHGEGPFVRALLGGAALEVARLLQRPILLVPAP